MSFLVDLKHLQEELSGAQILVGINFDGKEMVEFESQLGDLVA